MVFIVNYGTYSKWNKDDVEKDCPEYKTDENYVFPKGESFIKMQKRVVDFC